MADIKISQLGAAIAVDDSDLLPIVSNGNTLKAPASLVKNYAVGNTDLSGIGDGTPTGAIAALNTELGTTKQALTNVESDLSTITRTGTSNSGTKLNKETFFYLNGDLVQAIDDIANGATFTENTNYKAVDSGNGVLNQIGTTDNSALTVTARNGAVVTDAVFKQRNGVLFCSLCISFTDVTLNTEKDVVYISNISTLGYNTIGDYVSGAVVVKSNTSNMGTFILSGNVLYANVSKAAEGVISFVLVKE